MCLCSFVAFMCLTIKAYQYWGYIGVNMKSLLGKTIGKKVPTGNIDEVSTYAFGHETALAAAESTNRST